MSVRLAELGKPIGLMVAGLFSPFAIYYVVIYGVGDVSLEGDGVTFLFIAWVLVPVVLFWSGVAILIARLRRRKRYGSVFPPGHVSISDSLSGHKGAPWAILGSGIAIASIGVAGFASGEARTAPMENAVTTTATVTGVDAERVRRGTGASRHWEDRCVATYRYEVGGREFTGLTKSRLPGNCLPIGSEIVVNFDSQMPSVSATDTATSAWPFPLVLGASIAAYGVFLVRRR